MKNSVTFFLCLLFASSTFVSVQARSNQKSNLDIVIDKYSSTSITVMDKLDGASHKVDQKKILYSDIDKDGDLDAIVELIFCESARCDSTTQSSHMAVFLKSKKGYRFAAGHNFIKFNEDNSIELMGRIESIKNRKINVAVHGCEVDDVVCVPKFLYRAIYSFSRNRLVMVRAYARAS